jgi:SHS2 domain-containing protein
VTVRWALPQPYRDLEHTADAGVEVEGSSAAEALARLVLAQSALLAGGGPIAVERDEGFACAPGGTLEDAAIALLRELLFRFATRRVLPATCEVVALVPGAAEVRVGLGPYDPALHTEGLDLKAVTRHGARFEQNDGRWRARVIYDI